MPVRIHLTRLAVIVILMLELVDAHLLKGMTLEQRLLRVPAQDRVANAIRWSGLSQIELADAIGISPRMMGYLLHNQRKPLAYLPHLRLAHRLHVDPGVLAGLPEPDRETSTQQVPVPRVWRLFADAHGMSVIRVITEAVDEYISAAEDREHGYAPDPERDYPQIVMMPAWMARWMWAKALGPADQRIVTPEDIALVSVFSRKEQCDV